MTWNAGELTFSGSDSPKGYSNGTVEFTSATPYTPGLSQVSLVIVNNKNGVNASKILPVGNASQLTNVEFKGVYSINGNTVKKVETLTEGDKIDNLYLVYAGKDQYGMTSTDGASLTVNVASATGLTTNNKFEVVTVDGAKVIAKKLAVANGATVSATGNIAAAGSVTVLAVNTKNGNTDSQTLEVVAKVKIDSFTVSADVIYGGTKNPLNYTAIDTEGKEVTSFAAIDALINGMTSFDNKNGYKSYTDEKGNALTVPHVTVERAADGTAKLFYNAEDNKNTIAVPAILTFMSDTMKVSTVQLSVQENPRVVAISGVKDGVALAKTASTGSITIAQGDMLFVDQYGNAITDAQKTKNVQFYVAPAENLNGTCAKEDDRVTAVNVTPVDKKVSASTTVTASVSDVTGSDYSFNIALATIEDVTGYAIGDITLKEAGSEFTPAVTGNYNGVKVSLVAGADFVVRRPGEDDGAKAKVAKIDGAAVKTENGNVSVVIANKAGTVISKSYEYSNAPRKATTVKLVKNPSGITLGAEAKTATFKSQVEVADQYGNTTDDYTPYITISGFTADDTIEGNSTLNVKVTIKNPAVNTVHAVYNYGTVTAEFDIVVNH